MRSGMGILWLESHIRDLNFWVSEYCTKRHGGLGDCKATRSGFRWFGPTLGMFALKLVHHDLEQRELLFSVFGSGESDLGQHAFELGPRASMICTGR